MSTRLYVLALALLLGVASGTTQAAVTYTAPSIVAAACAKAIPGASMYHVRYAAKFVVDAVDAAHGRVIGHFPETAQPDAKVPVKCVDLVRL